MVKIEIEITNYEARLWRVTLQSWVEARKDYELSNHHDLSNLNMMARLTLQEVVKDQLTNEVEEAEGKL